MPNWHEGYLAYLAILRIGATYVPVVPTYADAEIRFILQDSGARLLFCPQSYRNRGYADAAKAIKRDGLVEQAVLIGDEPVVDGLN